jgi:type I restriction enzyme, S subunit
MSPELKFEGASNLYSKITDGTHDSPKQQETGKHLITSKHIKGRNIDFDTAYLISESDFNKINERSAVNQWDVIVSMIGEYCGFCYIERNQVIDYAVKNVGLYKAGSKLEAEWLYYYLTSPIGKQYLNSVKSGSSQPYLTLGGLRSLPILKPDNLIKKNQIVKVLSDLDKKIELNNKINAELEAVAKLIYDYWFVQFDFPDANGKPYKSSGGKMVFNDELKREIPDGWEAGTLLDIATFTNGIACQKYRPTENEDFYKVIKIREMGAGFTEKSEFVSQEIPEKVVVNNGDILFSWSATLDVKIWTGGTGGLNQHIFKVTSSKYSRTYYYFEVLRYLQHFKMIAELRKTTMGHITQDHLKQSRISIAPNKLIDNLHQIIAPILNKVVKNSEENQNLIELRDWLLPMLMNGQVTIKGA